MNFRGIANTSFELLFSLCSELNPSQEPRSDLGVGVSFALCWIVRVEFTLQQRLAVAERPLFFPRKPASWQRALLAGNH